MRRIDPRYPSALRSNVLWDMVQDEKVAPSVRAQLREIARHIDGERLRSGYFLVRS